MTEKAAFDCAAFCLSLGFLLLATSLQNIHSVTIDCQYTFYLERKKHFLMFYYFVPLFCWNQLCLERFVMLVLLMNLQGWKLTLATGLKEGNISEIRKVFYLF